MLGDLAQQRPLGGFMPVQALRGTMQRRRMRMMVSDWAFIAAALQDDCWPFECYDQQSWCCVFSQWIFQAVLTAAAPKAWTADQGSFGYQAVQKERLAYKLTFLCFVYYLKLNHVLVWKPSLFSSLHLSTAHCWRPFVRLIFRKHQSLEQYYSSWTWEVKTTSFGLFGSWCPTYSLCEDGTVVLL